MTPFTELSKLSVGFTMEMRPQKPNQAEKYLNTMLHCGNDKAAIATCDMDECTRINGG